MGDARSRICLPGYGVKVFKIRKVVEILTEAMEVRRA